MSGGNYDRSKKNSILNPAVSYAFALQVEAAFMLPCRSVRVFTKENEFDYYQEGGLNDYVHLLRKPISKPFTFQVERYVGVSGSADFNMGFLDPLTLGTDLILPLVLYVNRSPAPGWADNISFTNCARAYIFTGCTVTAKEYGELNAEQSKLLTETTTIAYRELFTINQISPAWEKGDSWSLTSAKEYLGSGGSKGDNRSSNDKKSDREAAASLWTLKKDDPYTGSGTSHEKNRSTNLSKKDMQDKAKNDRAAVWTLNKGDPYTGSGTSHKTNYSKNDSKETREKAASKWEYKDPPYTGGGTSHWKNRSKNLSKKDMQKESKNDRAALWTLKKGDPYTGSGTSHKSNYSKNDSKKTREEAASKWEYVDPPYTGGGTPHDGNRSKNDSKEDREKAASIYPPNRRALMADVLVESGGEVINAEDTLTN